MGDVIALLTAIVLVGYLVAVVDEAAFDLLHLFWFGRANRDEEVSPERILNAPAKRIAVMIPAWREAGVVSEMIRTTQRLMAYPPERVDFFVGVYPNDQETSDDVAALMRGASNVHAVVNWRPGPTTKSQNLNYVYRAIEDHEERTGRSYDGLAVHDAEDVVHPYAFRLYASLLDRHAMVQLPVFPLLPRRGFWRRMIAGTYVDEFAEQHLHHVPLREALGLFVPGAGTGFVVRRDVVRDLADEGPVFNEAALTEDYELALRLWARGHKVHFHLQRVTRVADDGSVLREYVGVREQFPQNAGAAIRQKGRWIYGVTLQTPRLLTRRTWAGLTWTDRLVLMRDGKGRFTNLVHLIGYPLATYATLAMIFDLPFGDVPYLVPLALSVLVLTSIRLITRGYFVSRAYGPWQGLMAAWLPPLVPLRWLVGNVLNVGATLRAWRLYLAPAPGAARGTAPAWDKTSHKGYADPRVLHEARRRLGDALILFGDVDARELGALVARQRREGGSGRIGEMAVRERLVSGEQVERRVRELEGSSDEEAERAPPS